MNKHIDTRPVMTLFGVMSEGSSVATGLNKAVAF